MRHALDSVRTLKTSEPTNKSVESQTKPEDNGDRNAEINHWNEIEHRASAGERLFWLNHPRVAQRYFEKSLVDGLLWRDWIIRQFNGPAETALELGCGNGAALVETLKAGAAKTGVGIDLDDSRFQVDRGRFGTALRFAAADLNRIEIEPNRYDLIYALHSFHHFEALEHIMEQVTHGLTDRGYFVLEEYVGPARFQWTNLQLSLTSQLLGIMPKPLRWYKNGIEKRAEGRSSPEEVIRVCPSEAIRSNEIVPLFLKYFDPIHHKKLGGTIQHLLYSGIIHNFPDGDSEIDHMIDCIDGIETTLIDLGPLPSDFVLLIGQAPSHGRTLAGC